MFTCPVSIAQLAVSFPNYLIIKIRKSCYCDREMLTENTHEWIHKPIIIELTEQISSFAMICLVNLKAHLLYFIHNFKDQLSYWSAKLNIFVKMAFPWLYIILWATDMTWKVTSEGKTRKNTPMLSIRHLKYQILLSPKRKGIRR